MSLVELSVTYVHAFHTSDSPINYNVKFGVALLRCAAPQILKCAWEEVVVFPSLALALNPMYSGIRLIDVVSMLSSEDIVQNLVASGFSFDGDTKVAHVWAQKTDICVDIPQTPHNPAICPDMSSTRNLTPSASDTSDPRHARQMLREHIPKHLKAHIQKLVVDLFPRDSDGVFLSEHADIPSMRRPSWVMDELYRSLVENFNSDYASKGMRYAQGYVRRERTRQVSIISRNLDATSAEREELRSQALVWQDGPYGKAWAANVRERPRPQ